MLDVDTFFFLRIELATVIDDAIRFERSGVQVNAGIEFEIIWLDEHMLEVRVTASNGRFAGTADCFCAHDEMGRLAALVRGFPASSTDRREMQIGTLDPRYAGGGAKLVFRCVDRAGHAVVDAIVQADSRATEGVLAETASFSIPVEAAAIDEFVAAWSAMRSVVGDVATLRSKTQSGSVSDD